LSGGSGFARRQRLLKAAEFEAVFANRCAARTTYFQVMARPNELGCARLGMVVSKRLYPLAVDRNRMRRLIREAFRHMAAGLPSVDLVVRPQTAVDRLPPNQAQRLDLADAINMATDKCSRAC
jgi:ribonuclease P protein component